MKLDHRLFNDPRDNPRKLELFADFRIIPLIFFPFSFSSFFLSFSLPFFIRSAEEISASGKNKTEEKGSKQTVVEKIDRGNNERDRDELDGDEGRSKGEGRGGEGDGRFKRFFLFFPGTYVEVQSNTSLVVCWEYRPLHD